MKIEIIVRWLDRTKSESEEVKARRLVDADYEPDESEMAYTYDPLVIDTDDISGFNKLEGNLTILRTVNQEAFCVNMQYERFKEQYENETGIKIKSFTNKEDQEFIDIS